MPVDGAAAGEAGDEASPIVAPAKVANEAPSADAATVAAVAAATASAVCLAAVANAAEAPSAAAALPPLLAAPPAEPAAAAPTLAAPAAPLVAPPAAVSAAPPPRPLVDAGRLVLHAICAANLPDADAKPDADVKPGGGKPGGGKPGGGKPGSPNAIGSDAYVLFRLVSADGATEVARAETSVQMNAVSPSWVGEQLTIALPRMRHGDAPPRLRMTLLDKESTNGDDKLGEAEVSLDLSKLSGAQLEVPLVPIVAAHAGMTISFSHTAIPRRYSAKSMHDGNKVVSRWRSLH